MKRNTLSDLNGYLFEQIERLNADELKGEELKDEIERARAVTGVATQIIANGNLALKAQIAYDEPLECGARKPEMLEG